MARPTMVQAPGLLHARTEQGLTQRDVADLAGVATSTVARIEAGGFVRMGTLSKLAGAVKVSPSRLQRDV